MNPERDIQKVPIHFEFGAHDPKDNIEPLKKRLENFFGSSPYGRVIIFTEQAYFGVPESRVVSLLVQKGFLPSDAFAHLSYAGEHGRFASNKELARYKRRGKDKKDFTDKELELFDEFAIKYPGRIWLFPEWSPEEEIKEYRLGKPNKAIEHKNKSMELALEGKFDEALPYYQESVHLLVERSRKREQRLVQTIKEELEDQADAIALAGHLGSAHTQVFHVLKNEGFTITRSFPQKDGRTYFYNPFDIMVRTLHFFPDRQISQEEWYSSLIASSLYESSTYLVELSKKKNISELTKTDQELARLSSSFHNLTADQIKELKTAYLREGKLIRSNRNIHFRRK